MKRSRIDGMRVKRSRCILSAGDYEPEDPPPEGYVQWDKWALVQYRTGLRQTRCPGCGRWRFPQERCCTEVTT